MSGNGHASSSASPLIACVVESILSGVELGIAVTRVTSTVLLQISLVLLYV